MFINRNKENIYQFLSLELAKQNLGSTKSNPSVGCIIEKNNSVISSGVTNIDGRPHAEYNALNKKINFKNSSLYASLEPCTHFGKTPPCVRLIKKKRIKKVNFSLFDYDVRTRKKSIKILKKAKIKTKTNILKSFANEIYQSYRLNKNKSLPLINYKLAISKDYFSVNKKSKYITNLQSLKIAQFLRSQHDCILTTSKSVINDNSILNCRIEGLEHKSPDIIIIDRNNKMRENLNIFKKNKNKKIIFSSYFKSKKFKDSKIYLIDHNYDFSQMIRKIFNLGYRRILIEAGLTFFNYCIKERKIHNLYLFMSKNKLLKYGTNYASSAFLKRVKINNLNKVRVNLSGDILYFLKLQNV